MKNLRNQVLQVSNNYRKKHRITPLVLDENVSINEYYSILFLIPINKLKFMKIYNEFTYIIIMIK